MKTIIKKNKLLEEYFERLEKLHKDISNISCENVSYANDIDGFQYQFENIIKELNKLDDEDYETICNYFLLNLQHDNLINIINRINIYENDKDVTIA